MSRTVTFQPSSELTSFIEEQVKSGLYANQSEVIRAALRLLQEQTARSNLKKLRSLIAEGDGSGEATAWDVEGFMNKMKHKHAAN